MYFLVNVCSNTYQPLWNVVGFIVKAIWIGIPILLIIFGMIDLGKAVIASKEDEVKKATRAFGKRFLYAVCVFLVVWLVGFVLNTVSGVIGTDANGDVIITNQNDWKACWQMIMNA